ncbi:hypothetical protein B0A48_14996 [Cryoendolithus antarcticus]|uniref:L-type lectin-like domain-containing protein n=1 Tax=Cryoendolithus antarcticus TaxID=1507870 RepID=A0A1V8SJE1_9PEZI|nr:hypothetical protein B0A48_14996 [Cryoendolithus antarcticus]
MKMIARPLLAAAILATSASARSIVDNLSFGTGERISPNGRGLPGWSVSAQGHSPQILSDRIVLTPPTPANTRGALWADHTLTSTDWNVDFSFRASGEYQGSGNLQLWLVQDKNAVGQNDLYGVEKFDGLAIVIDQYNNRGGSIRGFLNDGGQNFKSHSSLESLAFGHCDYSYRNLGRPSKLSITHDTAGLTVKIDDKNCFSTSRVALPSGYNFGITASTSETPDSFEIYSFAVSTAPNTHTGAPVQAKRADSKPSPPTLQKLSDLPSAPDFLPDTLPETLTSQKEQFADLHNRIQGVTHQIADMYALLATLGHRLDERHQELAASVIQHGSSRDQIGRIDHRVEEVERTVQRILRDVESKDYRMQLSEMREAVESVRGGVSEHLPEKLGQIVRSSSPRHWSLIGVVVGVQIALAAAYVVYKRRRAGAPKKYL